MSAELTLRPYQQECVDTIDSFFFKNSREVNIKK